MGEADGGGSIQHHLLGLLIKAHFTDTETEDQWLCPRCLVYLASSSQARPLTLRASATPKTMMLTEWMEWRLEGCPGCPIRPLPVPPAPLPRKLPDLDQIRIHTYLQTHSRALGGKDQTPKGPAHSPTSAYPISHAPAMPISSQCLFEAHTSPASEALAHAAPLLDCMPLFTLLFAC